MGYYIETDNYIGKADYFVRQESGIELMRRPNSISDVPADRGLVCIVDNGPFEAAAFVYNDNELKAFSTPTDRRFKRWVHIPLERAKSLSKYNR